MWRTTSGTTSSPSSRPRTWSAEQRAARRFSRYDHRGDTWPELLRAGVRGGTGGETLAFRKES